MATINDFQAALQAPHLAIADPEAAAGHLARNVLGQPIAYPGNNAITYRIEAENRALALRCFHRVPDDLASRYAIITSTLRTLRLERVPWCQFRFRGVYAGGQWNPAVLMPWVPGVPMNEALSRNLQPVHVHAIRVGFHDLLGELAAAGLAHGDLQHGNLLVDEGARVRVIDCDTMHVPSMRTGGVTGGHPNYQRPGRPAVVGPRADRFAALLIDLALHSLELMPWLWKRFDTGENLLFARSDLASPATSPLVRELKTHPDLYEKVRVLEWILATGAAEIPSLVPKINEAEMADCAYIDALDRQHLLEHVGSTVTVAGRPYSLRTGVNPRGIRFAFANFGPRSRGAFALKSWSDRRGYLPLDVAGLLSVRDTQKGWVMVRGLLTSTRGQRGVLVPELQVTEPSQLVITSSSDTAALMQVARDRRDRTRLAQELSRIAVAPLASEVVREREKEVRLRASRIGLELPPVATHPAAESDRDRKVARTTSHADVLNRLYGNST